MLKSSQLHQIFRLNPDNFVSNVWGGHWLPRWKKIRPHFQGPVGESWEFSSHSKHPSLLISSSGEAASLKICAKKFGKALFGRAAGGNAPFLLKFIDASDNLSLQVHPPLDYARRKERQPGKSESWLILDTKKDRDQGFISLGFRPSKKRGGASSLKSLFLKRVGQANKLGPSLNTRIGREAARLILPMLNRIQVKPGDIFHVPPRTPHLIGQGIRLYEIQSTSDLTYRIWDWNRPDPESLKKGIVSFRSLHLSKAFDVLDFHAHPPRFYKGRPKIVRTGRRGSWKERFLLKEKSNRYALNEIHFGRNGDDYEENLNNSFRVLTVMTGRVQLSFRIKGETAFRTSLILKLGESALVPAALAAYRMAPLRVPLRILKSYVP